jgi:uncharacterized membrane protein YkoI
MNLSGDLEGFVSRQPQGGGTPSIEGDAMNGRIGKLLVSAAAASAIALAVPVGAIAATGHHSHRSHATRASTANPSSSSTSASAETALTATTLASASAAALAAVPGTVESATTETDGTGAYEVIVAKSDGTRVKVVEDASFSVLSSAATNCR